jgi:prepilin-type N-terminal cleavage/methylation domain-containing protein
MRDQRCFNAGDHGRPSPAKRDEGGPARRSLAKRDEGGTAVTTDSGFTLLEILLAIALIALISATIIGASAHLLNSRSASPDDVFWQACAAARKSALRSGTEARLGFDDKTKSFLVTNGAASRSISVSSADDQLAISFLTTQGSASAVLVGGTLLETQSMPFVTFYPDGTCIPFRVQVRLRDGVHSIAIDPWTCARVLSQTNSNAGGAF